MGNETTEHPTGTVPDTAPESGSKPGDGTGGTPADKPSDAGGGGGAPAAVTTEFDRAKLHPALRGMTPEEITGLFEEMAAGMRTMAARGGQPGDGSRAAPPPAPPTPTGPTQEELKELFDPNSDKFNPERAVVALANKNFGKLIGDVNMRSVRGTFSTFRNEFPDFGEHEADILESLKGRDPSTVTDQDILSGYLMVKGLKVTQKERAEAAKRKGATTVAPTPKAETKEIQLTEEEVGVARRMFRNAPDPLKAYREWVAKDGDMTLTVPLGGGKRG